MKTKALIVLSCIVFGLTVYAQGQITVSCSSSNYICNVPCSGTSTALPVGGTPPYHYLWSPGNDTLATDSNLCAGIYVVEVTDSVGNTASDTVYISPVLIAADTIMNSWDSTQVCISETFKTYSWNEGDTGKCIEARAAGNYRVTVTDQNNCTAVSNTVTILACPVPNVSIGVSGDTCFYFGSIDSCMHFLLYRNDTLISSGNDPCFSPILPSDTFTLWLVMDSTCCGGVDTFLAYTYTYYSVPSGITGLNKEENINIYPNPTNNVWQLDLGDIYLGAAMEIFDEQGRLVSKSEVRSQKLELTANTLSSGVYYLRISNDKLSVVRKLVKL